MALVLICRALENKSFEIKSRGEIEVKGKGLMNTYFLLQNLHVTEDSIMGRGEGEPCMYRDDPPTLDITATGQPTCQGFA